MHNHRRSLLQPFVLFGAGGAGKSALLSKCARQSLKVKIKERWTTVLPFWIIICLKLNLNFMLMPNSLLHWVDIFTLPRDVKYPGVARPGQTAPHDQVLWNHSELHRPWSSPQVEILENTKRQSSNPGRSACRSATQTCCRSRRSQMTPFLSLLISR